MYYQSSKCLVKKIINYHITMNIVKSFNSIIIIITLYSPFRPFYRLIQFYCLNLGLGAIVE